MASAVVGLLRVLLTANTAQFSTGLKAAANQMQLLSRDLNSMGRQMTAVGTSLTKTLTLPLLAVGAGSAKLAMDFESSFAGVRKTVDATDKEFAQLAQGFRNLAKTIPVNVNELNKIGEAAGALGIKKGDILEFSRVMAQLGVTTNLTSDQAATSIAQIQNIFNASGKDTSQFASSLVALGNAGASTESQIVDFAARLAGAGHQIGLSQQSVLGFSSALASMGLNAEAGGTALSTVMSKMSVAVDTGGAKLEAFAKAAGMTSEAFKTLFKSDPTEAILKFTEGLGRAGASGENLTIILNEMGLRGTRVQDTMKRLAGSAGQMREQVDLSSKSWKENSALTEEARKRFETTESQLKLLWNRIQDVGITIGNALLPMIKGLIAAFDVLIPVFESLARMFAGLPTSIQTTIVVFGALLAAVGPVLFIFGQLITSAGTVAGAFGRKGIATQALASNLGTLGVASTKTSIALGVLGKTAAAAGAAFIGWEIGRLIADLLGLDQKIANTVTGLNNLKQARDLVAQGKAQEAQVAITARLTELEEKRSIALARNDYLTAALMTTQINALKTDQTRLALQDTINLAISRGAANTIKYSEAVAFNQAWLLKQKDAHAGAAAAIQRTDKAAGALTDKLDEQNEKLAEADRQIAELSKTARDKLAVAIRAGVFTVKELMEASGLSEIAVKRFTDQLKDSTRETAKHQKGLEGVTAALKPLTAEQAAYITSTEGLKLTAELIAKKFDISARAVTNYRESLKAAAKLEKELAEIAKVQPLKDLPGETSSDWDGQQFARDQEANAKLLEEFSRRTRQVGMSDTAFRLDQIEIDHKAALKALGDKTVANEAFYDTTKTLIDTHFQHERDVANKTDSTFVERMQASGVRTREELRRLAEEAKTAFDIMRKLRDEKGQQVFPPAAIAAAGEAAATARANLIAASAPEENIFSGIPALLGAVLSGNDVKQAAITYGRKIGQQFATEMFVLLPSKFNKYLTGVPELISKLIKGGGGVADAGKNVASSLMNTVFGDIFSGKGKLGEMFSKVSAPLVGGIGKLFGKTIGSAVEKAIPGLGPILAAFALPALAKLGSALGKAFGFGPSNRELAEREIKKFAEGHGGLEGLHSKLLTVGTAGETLWKNLREAKNPGAAKKAIEAVNVLLGKQKLLQDQIAAKQGEQASTQAEIAQKTQAALEKYGLTWKDMGREMQDAHLDEEANNLYEEMQLLQRAGVDTGRIFEVMHDNISKYLDDATTYSSSVTDGFGKVIQSMIDTGHVTDADYGKLHKYFLKAVQAGIEIPESWKPIVQKLIDMGFWTDVNKDGIVDLQDTGLTFSQTMTGGFQSIVDKLGDIETAIRDLIQSLIDLGNEGVTQAGRVRRAWDEVTGHAIPKVPSAPPPPSEPEPEPEGGGFAVGGIVRRLMPKGFSTDTVLARLTPGEGVLNTSAMRAIGSETFNDLNAGRLATPEGTGSSGPETQNIFHAGAFSFDGLVVDTAERAAELAMQIAKEIRRGGKILTTWQDLPLTQGT